MATQRPPTPISPSKPTENPNIQSQTTLLNIATTASQNDDTALAQYICQLLLTDPDLSTFQKADCYIILASTSKELPNRITYLEKGISAFDVVMAFQGDNASRALGNSLRGLKETLKGCKELETLKASLSESDEVSQLNYIFGGIGINSISQGKENRVPEKKDARGNIRDSKRRTR
jgi:hypothetical protein